MSRRWITVLTGPMSEVLVCQGLLEANGFPTFVLDSNLKVIDPFMTGANAFSVQLQVPDGDESEATRVLAYRAPEAEEEEEAAPPGPAAVQLRKLALHIRWASLAGFTAPYALWLA